MFFLEFYFEGVGFHKYTRRFVKATCALSSPLSLPVASPCWTRHFLIARAQARPISHANKQKKGQKIGGNNTKFSACDRAALLSHFCFIVSACCGCVGGCNNPPSALGRGWFARGRVIRGNHTRTERAVIAETAQHPPQKKNKAESLELERRLAVCLRRTGPGRAEWPTRDSTSALPFLLFFYFMRTFDPL